MRFKLVRSSESPGVVKSNAFAAQNGSGVVKTDAFSQHRMVPQNGSGAIKTHVLASPGSCAVSAVLAAQNGSDAKHNDVFAARNGSGAINSDVVEWAGVHEAPKTPSTLRPLAENLI